MLLYYEIRDEIIEHDCIHAELLLSQRKYCSL
jgi:hypothetical protein